MDVKDLSPVHFRSHDEKEKTAYVSAYNQLLSYHGFNDRVAMPIMDMLRKALFNGNTDDLMHWYLLHSKFVKKY